MLQNSPDSHAPTEYADRQTLWNAIEKAEYHPKVQLAYSFDFALQNEFSMEKNIVFVRQFLLDEFVSRGMIADFADHQPDREKDGISPPLMFCPIRSLDGHGLTVAMPNLRRKDFPLVSTIAVMSVRALTNFLPIIKVRLSDRWKQRESVLIKAIRATNSMIKKAKGRAVELMGKLKGLITKMWEPQTPNLAAL